MTSLTMSQLQFKGRPPGGQVNITVEPSPRIGDGRSGVYVRINDHFAVDSADAGGRTRLISLLEYSFDTSMRRSDGIVDHIMSLAKEG